MKKFNSLLKISIGIVILLVLIYKVGVKEIYSNLLRLNLFYLPFVITVLFIINLWGALKLSFFLPPLKIKMPFWKIYHYYFLTSCFGMFIPGRLGELSLVYFLKKEDIGLGMGSAITVLDKILSLSTTLLISVVGVFLFFDFQTSIKIILIGVFPFVIAIYLIFSGFGRMIMRKFILRKFESRFHGFSKVLFYILRNNKSVVLQNFVFSFIKSLTNALFIFLLFYAVGRPVSFWFILLINSIGILVSFVPVSISGLGIKESLGVFLFNLIKVPVDISSTVLILSLIINYSVAFIYVLLFFNIKNFGSEIKKGFRQKW